jgi:mRNA interferase MazF
MTDWQAEGLNVPSAIKGQICTIEDRLIRRSIGSLTQRDQAALDANLRSWLSL